jgi:hypothetical protein
LNKARVIFLSVIFLEIFVFQFIFFLFIIKINNLDKILRIKNTLYKIILLSDNTEKEFKGYRINDNSFIFTMPSIDINKTFIPDNKDIVTITHDKSTVLFKLNPSEYSIRKNKTIKFKNIKSLKIADCGLINFFCNINDEILESDFYMNKNISLFPDDFTVF